MKNHIYFKIFYTPMKIKLIYKSQVIFSLKNVNIIAV